MDSEFFSPLFTKSSECVRRNLFGRRNTVFMPDFFVIILWMTIFFCTLVLDIAILFCLITQQAWGAIVALLICFCLHSVFEIFINTTALDINSFSCNKVVIFFIYSFGYGPIVTCIKILIINYKIWKSLKLDSQGFPFPIFHVSNENFSILKMFCFIYVVLKGIPQIFILCILLVQRLLSGNAWFLLTASISLNMVIFSQMMASLLPIRKTPAYYLHSGCVVLNAMIKYLATMCACCIQVELFSMAFREIGYYAILVYIFTSLIWLWPCWQVLQSQQLSKFQFGTYFILFLIVFSFIYIHPFEKHGLIYYYFFYLINLLSEIYLLYMWCNPNTLEITYYFSLKAFFLGLIFCFGMVNFLLRFRPPESKIYTIIQSQKTEGNNAGAEKNKTKGNKKGVSTVRIYFY